MRQTNKISLEEIINLLDQGNADIKQYVFPQVEYVLRERFKRIQREKRRQSLPWFQGLFLNLVYWCRKVPNEPLCVKEKYSDGTEGFIYEVALNVISGASGIPIGQDLPHDRAAAVLQEMRRVAKAIAFDQSKLGDGFASPETIKDVDLARDNWETLFVHLLAMVKGLPRGHKAYWD